MGNVSCNTDSNRTGTKAIKRTYEHVCLALIVYAASNNNVTQTPHQMVHTHVSNTIYTEWLKFSFFTTMLWWLTNTFAVFNVFIFKCIETLERLWNDMHSKTLEATCLLPYLMCIQNTTNTVESVLVVWAERWRRWQSQRTIGVTTLTHSEIRYKYIHDTLTRAHVPLHFIIPHQYAAAIARVCLCVAYKTT